MFSNDLSFDKFCSDFYPVYLLSDSMTDFVKNQCELSPEVGFILETPESRIKKARHHSSSRKNSDMSDNLGKSTHFEDDELDRSDHTFTGFLKFEDDFSQGCPDDEGGRRQQSSFWSKLAWGGLAMSLGCAYSLLSRGMHS